MPAKPPAHSPHDLDILNANLDYLKLSFIHQHFVHDARRQSAWG